MRINSISASSLSIALTLYMMSKVNLKTKLVEVLWLLMLLLENKGMVQTVGGNKFCTIRLP